MNIILLTEPRSGSSWLASLMRSHPQIGLAGEILNDEILIENDIFKHIEAQLLTIKKPIRGFKLTIQQIKSRNMSLLDIIRYFDMKALVILWREKIVERLSSLKIAELTKIWSTEQDSILETPKINISKEEIESSYVASITLWKLAASQIPVDIKLIFMSYEKLLTDSQNSLIYICRQLSLETIDHHFTSSLKKQEKCSLEYRLSNYSEMNSDVLLLRLNADLIINEEIYKKFLIPNDKLNVIPDREPAPPPGGWTFRVSFPYLPTTAKDYILDAIDGASVSSAGIWPEKMSDLLKKIFGVPVAIPCCNGFTALLLALQASNILLDSEVILPTFTMIAVANAVHYNRSHLIFIDNSENNYNPKWQDYERAITDKTKGIIVCHPYGVPASDIEYIASQCKERNLVLIEDISECLGISILNSSNKEQLLGTFGDFAACSMYANKIAHGGDAGFVLCQKRELKYNLQTFLNHGFTPSFHFVHFEKAINAKINGLGAALAVSTLSELEQIIKHRRELASRYRMNLEQIKELTLMPRAGYLDSPWVFGVQTTNKRLRTCLRTHLANAGIETRNYFFPLHLQPVYLSPTHRLKDASNAELLATTGKT